MFGIYLLLSSINSYMPERHGDFSSRISAMHTWIIRDLLVLIPIPNG